MTSTPNGYIYIYIYICPHHNSLIFIQTVYHPLSVHSGQTKGTKKGFALGAWSSGKKKYDGIKPLIKHVRKIVYLQVLISAYNRRLSVSCQFINFVAHCLNSSPVKRNFKQNNPYDKYTESRHHSIKDPRAEVHRYK